MAFYLHIFFVTLLKLFKMKYRNTLLILLFLLFDHNIKAQISLTTCDHLPTADDPCDGYDFSYLQYLAPVTQNGKTKLEKELFFILDGIKALNTDTITFKVFQTIDAKKKEYKLITERNIAIKRDWVYCWTKFVFDKPNDYWISAYNKDTLLEESFVSLKKPL